MLNTTEPRRYYTKLLIKVVLQTKRLFALLTAVLLMFTCVVSTAALESPTPVEHYAVRTLINGTGEASSNVTSVEIGSDETVILTATEIYKSFSFWDTTVSTPSCPAI